MLDVSDSFTHKTAYSAYYFTMDACLCSHGHGLALGRICFSCVSVCFSLRVFVRVCVYCMFVYVCVCVCVCVCVFVYLGRAQSRAAARSCLSLASALCHNSPPPLRQNGTRPPAPPGAPHT